MNICVTIPTYNESENIKSLIEEIRQVLPIASILVVDDSSPDGTSNIVESIQKADSKIHLLTRPSEVRGRGWAGRDGFIKALELNADFIVEMDADFSHHPKYLNNLLEPLVKEQMDVTIGSRYIKGGSDMERPRYRKWISFCAQKYLSLILGFKVQDPTSGYRAFTRKALEKIHVQTLKSRDPFIVTEVLYRCYKGHLKIKEVPIKFVDRNKGNSKLKSTTLIKYLISALFLPFSA
jgi:dolichol-phosphate mannosyltransferase